jgi:hypothetical protein
VGAADRVRKKGGKEKEKPERAERKREKFGEARCVVDARCLFLF